MILTHEQFHEALVVEGTVSEAQFICASEKKEASQIGVGEVLVSQGVLTDLQLGQLLAMWYNVPFVNLDQKQIEQDVLHLLPESFARTHELIPISASEQEVMIATSDPRDVAEQSLLEKYLRRTVRFSFTTSSSIKNHLYLFQKDPKTIFEEILNKKQNTNTVDTSVIELVNGIFDHAYQSGASDIHIEPEEKCTMIRYRQDGVLHDIAELPVAVHEHIMTRLKVLARLATDEHRIAQDGRIRYKTPWSEQLDIRLSIVPTTQAEKAVMRLLTEHLQSYSLNDLGLCAEDFRKVSEAIHKPWGMLLITGPTGSGKSTTLYSILKILNQREVNITTIEDPVEYEVEGVSQIQVNEKTGLTFASGLRSIVRQDPDIIMVGEIRDKETASISINAAMTGHLLLSTLHTND
ncbi:MAG: GspE/PulE family protein, partial [Patescibacteria group bacterium]